MITSKRLVLGMLVFSVLSAGCASERVSATVDGSDIPDSDVHAIRVGAEDATSVLAEAYRSDLTRLIITEAMVSGAETDFGISGLDTPEAREAYLESLTAGEQQILESIVADESLSTFAFDIVVTQLALRSAVRDELGADEDVPVEVCASHILVATEEEAAAVLARLDAGEDFSDLAGEVSLDTQSPGGALPCPVLPSAFAGPFADAVTNAPVGELTGPIETEFGWHIILVHSRDVSSESIDSLWNAWINDAVDRADIEVRSDIGTWYPPVDGIIAPPPSP